MLSDEWHIVLFNDNHNTFDHVIDCLMEVCGHDALAEQRAMIVHFKGKCTVKSGDYDEFSIQKSLSEKICLSSSTLNLVDIQDSMPRKQTYQVAQTFLAWGSFRNSVVQVFTNQAPTFGITAYDWNGHYWLQSALPIGTTTGGDITLGSSGGALRGYVNLQGVDSKWSVSLDDAQRNQGAFVG